MDKYIIVNINMFARENQVFIVSANKDIMQVGAYTIEQLPEIISSLAYERDIYNVKIFGGTKYGQLLEQGIEKTENLKYNNLYRWFIGYNLCEDVPNHSTYSQNYKRKFCKLEKDLLQTVFDKVIELLINFNCLDMTAVYIDSTHTKAYANKKKNHK